MKLVEILARELEEWPDRTEIIVQDVDGRCWPSNRGFNPVFEDGCWSSDISEAKSFHCEAATDHTTAIVTRAQWESERAKTKAPKADADGWIRHRGRKCPVPAGTRVSTKHRDGTITPVHHLTADPMASNVSLKAVWEHKKDQYDIMYYKLHKPAEKPALVSEETIKTTGPCTPDTMLAIRDRIRALDTHRAEVEELYQRQSAEITQERESLVQKLAGEGLAMVEVVVQPVEGMSDPDNWLEGDFVECVSNDEKHAFVAALTIGKIYRVREVGGGTAWILDDDGCSQGTPSKRGAFKWHSRPAT